MRPLTEGICTRREKHLLFYTPVAVLAVLGRACENRIPTQYFCHSVVMSAPHTRAAAKRNEQGCLQGSMLHKQTEVN